MKRLYAIRDNKVAEFNPPCIFANDAAAVRAFGDLVLRDKSNMISIHREDFSLYFIGLYNSETGFIDCSSEPIRALAVGSDFADDKE